MDFITLASGSQGNAYLVAEGERHILIECGLSLSVIRRLMNVQVAGLDGCLVSHSHGDHAKSIRHLMERGVDCFMSRGTADELGVKGHRLHTVGAGEQFKLGLWDILPFATVHDTAEPLGFLIQSPTGKLLFATDTAYLKHRFVGLTHIAIECNYDIAVIREAIGAGTTDVTVAKRVIRNHMGLAAVKRMLAVNDLTKVKEIHLLHLSDSHSDEARFRTEIEAQTGKPVYIGGKNEMS